MNYAHRAVWLQKRRNGMLGFDYFYIEEYELPFFCGRRMIKEHESGCEY